VHQCNDGVHATKRESNDDSGGGDGTLTATTTDVDYNDGDNAAVAAVHHNNVPIPCVTISSASIISKQRIFLR